MTDTVDTPAQPDGPVAKNIERIGPTDLADPRSREEFRKALVWLSTALGIALVIVLAQPILLIIGGMVVATIFDGGARLLGRVLPVARGIRLTIVILAGVAFLVWTVILAGTQLTVQAAALRTTVEGQVGELMQWATNMGLISESTNLQSFGREIFNSLGRVTAAVTTALGAMISMAMILVLGIFLAAEPRLYEHGLAWMLPVKARDRFYGTMDEIGRTLRRLMAGRLLGMAIEGFATWGLLSLAGVPMAALLGVLTGILAFLPNIGAIISGVLLILVGFSAGFDTGLYAIAIYVVVQVIDGYLIVPIVAKRAVDLAPALVLGAQILFGALFGILGLALADPIIAMIKVALERRSENTERSCWRNTPSGTPSPQRNDGRPVPG